MAWLAWLENSAFSTWLLGSDSIWAFPTVLTVHTFGVMLLAGASTAVALRLLGAARSIPLEYLQPLFPVMWGGFWLNLVSGTMLFCADATRKGTMPLFYVKMGLVAAGVVSIVLTRRSVFAPGAGAAAIEGRGRMLALVSLACWVLAITAGRFLAYVEQ
jgi:hypothetical protein